MATIEQFNEVIERAKTKADFSAVVWMKRTDAQVGVTSIQKRKNQVFVFRQVIAWKDTDHAAIIANGHVMAIWHRDGNAQPAPDSAAPAAAPAEDVKVAKPGMFNRLLRMQLASLGETDLHTLKQQITAMRQENADLIIERDAMDADRKRLKAALTPFAELARAALKTLPDHATPESVWYQLNDVEITIAHFFAVIEALADEVKEA